MHILMTGGTGFIASNLVPVLVQKGYKITALTRSTAKAKQCVTSGVNWIERCSEIDALPHIDGLINLAGAPIADRPWTRKRKALLMDSRVAFSEELFKHILTNHNPQVVLNGSAIGFYGSHASEQFTEHSDYYNTFSHELCAKWEQTTDVFQEARVVLLRTGVVLGKGGMLKKLLPSYAMGLGSVLGDGKQWLSWIHIHDMVNAIEFCLEEQSLQGPVNCVAPEPVTQEEFANTLSLVLKRPRWLTLPSWLFKKTLGQMAEELLLSGQYVVPQKLQQHGFKFIYPELLLALQQIVKK